MTEITFHCSLSSQRCIDEEIFRKDIGAGVKYMQSWIIQGILVRKKYSSNSKNTCKVMWAIWSVELFIANSFVRDKAKSLRWFIRNFHLQNHIYKPGKKKAYVVSIREKKKHWVLSNSSSFVMTLKLFHSGLSQNDTGENFPGELWQLVPAFLSNPFSLNLHALE